jgi:hypothetical protein
MRLYHFVSEIHGLTNITKRRIKIAQIDDLNDPFELRSFSLGDRQLRSAFEKTRASVAETRGMVCFSKIWSNPVQWSHYADRHRGLCLGFDVADELCEEVSYRSKLVVPDMTKIRRMDDAAAEAMRSWFKTKYSHWKYEQEVRVFTDLSDLDPEERLYFADFGDALRLREVIVGANCELSRDRLREALGELASEVTALKARLAFRSFRVVRQRAESMWQ